MRATGVLLVVVACSPKPPAHPSARDDRGHSRPDPVDDVGEPRQSATTIVMLAATADGRAAVAANGDDHVQLWPKLDASPVMLDLPPTRALAIAAVNGFEIAAIVSDANHVAIVEQDLSWIDVAHPQREPKASQDLPPSIAPTLAGGGGHVILASRDQLYVAVPPP